MRRFLALSFLLLIAAKGGKNKDQPTPTPAPVATPTPAPVEEPPPPPPEPKVVRNANLNVTFTFMDGTTKAGHVVGIERAIDFYGDEGWSEEDGKLKLTVESGSTEKMVAWTDIKSITITPGKMPDEVDCTYSSDFSPWMYDCTLRTTAAVVLKDGSKGTITTRNRWRFSYDDGSSYEFQVFKYSLREQDTTVVEYGSEQAENYGLYTKLQDMMRTDLKGKMPKMIVIN